jgi:hypothetical protein
LLCVHNALVGAKPGETKDCNPLCLVDDVFSITVKEKVSAYEVVLKLVRFIVQNAAKNVLYLTASQIFCIHLQKLYGRAL